MAVNLLIVINLCSVWVARRPPGYAFVEFDDNRDAMDAIRALDGQCRKNCVLFIIFVVFACIYFSFLTIFSILFIPTFVHC